jgi:beta-galactosidase
MNAVPVPSHSHLCLIHCFISLPYSMRDLAERSASRTELVNGISMRWMLLPRICSTIVAIAVVSCYLSIDGQEVKAKPSNHLLNSSHSKAISEAERISPVFIDASAPYPEPRTVRAALGTAKNPAGETITVNSQFLLLNGTPWLPVMGEFHYSRYPEGGWETEILKMKAAGIQVVATYVFWIHHEEIEGQFDWSSQHNLRHFVELCAKHGLYVYPRIGPWAHGEARNGGLPDWVLKKSPTRRNDPTYLAEVWTLYSQIGDQLKGLLWKDGGPVIGIQLENEYHQSGPGAGAAHIEKLKQLALAAGIDVPLYTVTGWDGAAVPSDAVLPVFGGYPAAPWERSPGPLPPSEVYTFRFENRVAGNMGTVGGHGQNAASVYEATPFLTAEVGGGIEDTYFRRPVIEPDDVAAMAPVMLGSGANLLGFYMFHGGRNPNGSLSTLQESQRTGYPTDVPVKSYDFQAPLGEFGQERESLKRLKLINYFLNDFGNLLAPMQVFAPQTRPASPADVSVPRIAVRSDGDHAFIFFNNYVRDLVMPARSNFQADLKLHGKTLKIPASAIEIPAKAYGVWPVNLDLDGYKLIYSTAQLFKRYKKDGESYYFFFAIPGISPEFAINAEQAPRSVSKSISTSTQNGVTYFKVVDAGSQEDILLDRAAHHVHLILIPRSQAENLWNIDGSNHLLLTDQQFFSDKDRLYLQSDGDPNFTFSIFGTAQEEPIEAGTPIQKKTTRLFTQYTARVAPVSLPINVNPVQKAEKRLTLQNGPMMSWSKQAVPLAPDDGEFKGAGIWNIKMPTYRSDELSNVFLKLDYIGDVARLYSGAHLLDDNFWNGISWEVGLKELSSEVQDGALHLDILPLPKKYPMCLEVTGKIPPNLAPDEAHLIKVEFVPQYRLAFRIRK